MNEFDPVVSRSGHSKKILTVYNLDFVLDPALVEYLATVFAFPPVGELYKHSCIAIWTTQCYCSQHG